MGIRNLRQFHLAIDRFEKKIDERGILFQKKVAFMVLGAFVLLPGGVRGHSGVLQMTPVDTGRAIGNWQLSVGRPTSKELDVEFGAGGSPGVRAAAEAYATKSAVSKIARLRFGQSVFIVNSVAYIVVLNDGGEKRRAHRMVERSIENTKAALKDAA